MIESIDHIVITVVDLEATLTFYERALGMRRLIESGRPTALVFGRQKINVHQNDNRFAPFARHPTPGSADICFVTRLPIEDVRDRIEREGIAIELGPVPRTGALGDMMSVYFRDPDGNLIEVAAYTSPDLAEHQ